MSTIQSGVGKIRIFEDFIGHEWPITNTDETPHVGPFRIVGETPFTDADTGFTSQEAEPNLNGVMRMTSPNESDNDAIGLCTAKMFDVALMGTLIAEVRLQFDDLETLEFYCGFTGDNADDVTLEGDTIHGADTTVTLTEDDLCGFLYSAELTEDEMWHCVYNGGTTTGETVSTSVESGVDAVADEYNILRVEVDPNGTARWYIDGVLKQTVEGAVSLTEDLAFIIMIESKAASPTNYNETVDMDYILIEAKRDWTV
jgi:hypothetical protein